MDEPAAAPGEGTTAQAPAPDVVVTPDGPYLVSRRLPLRRRHHIDSEHGDPITWSTPQQVEVPGDGETYALCRCGGSSHKPFCDGTHRTNGFDGSESAPTDTYAERSTAYPATGVTVRDDRSICQHAAFCGNQVTNVWKMTHSSDDPVVRAQMIAMVEHCPSGALTYRVDGEDVDGEPDLTPAVNVVADGPLWVTGSAVVQRSDGGTAEPRPRVTLCRCGASGNKPFCDGTHAKVGFTDS